MAASQQLVQHALAVLTALSDSSLQVGLAGLCITGRSFILFISAVPCTTICVFVAQALSVLGSAPLVPPLVDAIDWYLRQPTHLDSRFVPVASFYISVRLNSHCFHAILSALVPQRRVGGCRAAAATASPGSELAIVH
jgi:hypothetical protein